VPSNQIVQLQAVVTVQNNLLAAQPYLSDFDFNNPTLNTTAFYGDIVAALPIPGVTLQLPSATVWCAMVQNIAASGLLQVTPTPGAAITLGPQGVWSYFDPTETGSGITNLVVGGVGGATVLCLVLLGA